jgi:hypothetical protein
VRQRQESQTLRFTLSLSIDTSQYPPSNSAYGLEDMLVDEVCSSLYSLRYVTSVDMRRSPLGARDRSLFVLERSSR